MFDHQKSRMFTKQKQEKTSEIMNKFGRYGESFHKFGEEFYNYKISYNIVFEHLNSIINILKTARPNLPQTMQGYISLGQYQNLEEIKHFIKMLENNIIYMAFNDIKIIDEKIPEKNPELLMGISKADMYGFPHGWNKYIQDKIKGYGFYNLKETNNPDIINWDILFAKLLHFDTSKMAVTRDKISLESSMVSENSPASGFHFKEKEAEDYRKTCQNVFANSPRSVIEQLHKTEKMIFENGCNNRITYLSYRYYLNTLAQYMVNNTPNAYQIRTKAVIEKDRKPTKLDAVKKLVDVTKRLPLKDHDNEAKNETLEILELAVDNVEKKLPVERIPTFLQNGANVAFTGLHVMRDAQKTDFMILNELLRKRTR